MNTSLDLEKYEFIDVDKEFGESLLSKNIKYTKEMFGTEEWIPVDKIKIDLKVQRELQKTHVEKIANKFDPSAFGRLTVNLREDGYYYCTNGQHRLEALRLKQIKEAPCVVVDLYDIQEEGQNFIKVNEQSAKVSTLDKYRIGVHSNVVQWLRVKEVIDHVGLEAGTGVNKINCVGVLYKYINKVKSQTSIDTNIQILKITLHILKSSFGVEGITGIMVTSMATFVRHYVITGDATIEESIKRFSKCNYKEYGTKANQMKEKSGGRGKIINYIAFLLYSDYNKNKKNKLQPKIVF